MDKHNFMYKVLSLFNVSNGSIIDLNDDLNSFALQNTTDLSNINNDLNSFALQNTTDINAFASQNNNDLVSINDDLEQIQSLVNFRGFSGGFQNLDANVPDNTDYPIISIRNDGTNTIYPQFVSFSFEEEEKKDNTQEIQIYKNSTLSNSTYNQSSGNVSIDIDADGVVLNQFGCVVHLNTMKKDGQVNAPFHFDLTQHRIALQQNDVLTLSVKTQVNNEDIRCSISWFEI